MRDAYKVAILFVALLALILAMSGYPRYETAYALTLGLAILGAALLLDAGLVNFGYGMYVAAGAYTVALLYKHLKITDVALTLPLAAAVGGLLGLAVGLATSRLRGIFYALMTLAFSMIIYGILVKFYQFTGGSDGVTVAKVTALGARFVDIHVAVLAATIAALALWFRAKYLSTALGHIVQGIRENELRLIALGVNTGRVVAIISTLSGIWGGLSGALLAYLTLHVSPDLSFWSYSTFLLIGALVAQATSPLYGFLIGAAVSRILNIAAYFGSAYYPGAYDLTMGAGLLAVYIIIIATRRYATGI